jgi:hypothetical protein
MRQAGPFFFCHCPASQSTSWFLVSSPCVAQFSRIFANRLFSGLPASSCVVYMTIPARQGLTRHQRAISYGIKVYISPTGLQLRFRFTMVASMSVPFVECPPRHVTCPFLNLLTPLRLNSLVQNQRWLPPDACSRKARRSYGLSSDPSLYTLLTPSISSLLETHSRQLGSITKKCDLQR